MLGKFLENTKFIFYIFACKETKSELLYHVPFAFSNEVYDLCAYSA